ncbi:MAG: YraN family protein, partial [Acidobacteriota bacterium]|nr:YraN family protein [Acidobacteriota bacterium]
MRYRIHRDSGRRGEDLAHRYVRRLGYIVVARNWRPPQGGGEIDLIARDGESVIFIEVKYRASGAWSAPERAVDGEKIRVLRRA